MPPQKILLLAYYWPPSGGAGVQRWLKLTHYLAELGVEVHVLTLEAGAASYPQLDESLLADVHPRVHVHRTKSFEPLRVYARLSGKDKVPAGGFANTATGGSWKQDLVMRLRTHLFIPDPRKYWKHYALPEARRIIREHDIQTVMTTSTPPSVHLIGRALRRELPVRWIADFRDPWTEIYYYPLLLHSRWSAGIDRQLELSVLREADHLTTVSEGLKKGFLRSVPERPATDVTVVANGFDPRDFAGPVQLEKRSGFTITYTGTMSDQYTPGPFLTALAEVIAARPDAGILLEVVGEISGNIKRAIDEHGIPLLLLPAVPHAEINDYQRRADALFLALPQVPGGEGILTGKLFEYLAARRPVIALGMPGAEVAGILTATAAGRLFTNNQVADMAMYLRGLVDENLPFAPDENRISAYSRKAQAAQIAGLL
jgi:glycosyltransferase involved in cell wall biosynthesis